MLILVYKPYGTNNKKQCKKRITYKYKKQQNKKTRVKKKIIKKDKHFWSLVYLLVSLSFFNPSILFGIMKKPFNKYPPTLKTYKREDLKKI